MDKFKVGDKVRLKDCFTYDSRSDWMVKLMGKLFTVNKVYGYDIHINVEDETGKIPYEVNEGWYDEDYWDFAGIDVEVKWNSMKEQERKDILQKIGEKLGEKKLWSELPIVVRIKLYKSLVLGSVK